MRGIDPHCCGSIRGRGTKRGKEAVERWMEKDSKGTKYEFLGDVYPLLRQLEAGSGYGLYSPALQGQAGAGLYLENRQGQRSDWGVSITVVC